MCIKHSWNWAILCIKAITITWQYLFYRKFKKYLPTYLGTKVKCWQWDKTYLPMYSSNQKVGKHVQLCSNNLPGICLPTEGKKSISELRTPKRLILLLPVTEWWSLEEMYSFIFDVKCNMGVEHSSILSPSSAKMKTLIYAARSPHLYLIRDWNYNPLNINKISCSVTAHYCGIQDNSYL